jgi:hypothetical protein
MLQYQYNLAGQLKQITDPWNATVTYNRDKTGRETGLTATGYKDQNQWTNRDVTTFASNIKYRAWSGIKDFANGSPIGNGSFAMGYDSRLRMTRFTGAGRTTEHDYYNDGQVKEVRDLYYGSNFLRKYEYDQAARLTKAHAGGTAQTAASPYSLNYGYDEWGHTTSRTGSNWSNALANFSATYTNNHDNNMKYDPAGNVKNYFAPSTDDAGTYYDAANQQFTQFVDSGPYIARIRENYYDGDGKKVFYKTNNGSFVNGSYTHTGDYYYIRSSVLGGAVVAEYNDFFAYSFTDSMSYVYLKGVQVAFQRGAHQTTGDKYVVWTSHNPVVGSYLAQYQLNNSSYQPVTYPYGEMLTDPLGSYIGVSESLPPVSIPEPFTFAMGQSIDQRGKCYADYVETPCSVVQRWLNSGVGEHAPWDNTDTRWVKNANNGNGGYVLHVYGVENGYYGFRPTGTSNWARPKLQPRGSQADTAGEEEKDDEWEPARRILRENIARIAENQKGSQQWLYDVAKDNFDPGDNKCNKFVADVLTMAGVPGALVPKRPGIIGAILKRPPLAGEWANPNFNIPGWAVVTDGSVQRGDIIAEPHEYSDASGHVGIVVGARRTASASAVADPAGLIVINDWGFRPENHVTIRRYVGPVFKTGRLARAGNSGSTCPAD